MKQALLSEQTCDPDADPNLAITDDVELGQVYHKVQKMLRGSSDWYRFGVLTSFEASSLAVLDMRLTEEQKNNMWTLLESSGERYSKEDLLLESFSLDEKELRTSSSANACTYEELTNGVAMPADARLWLSVDW